MKQSLLHKQWIDDDINGDSQKHSSKSSFNKIILKNVEEGVKK